MHISLPAFRFPARFPLLGLDIPVHNIQHLVRRLHLDPVQRLAHIHLDDVLLIVQWSFEIGELAVHHVGAHVVILAGSNALQEDLLCCIEVDEVDEEVGVVVRGNADDVAVLALEGRAGEDDAVGAAVDAMHGFFPEGG